jgi:hypothetical protein
VAGDKPGLRVYKRFHSGYFHRTASVHGRQRLRRSGNAYENTFKDHDRHAYLYADKYSTASYIYVYQDPDADLYKNTDAYIYINADEHCAAGHINVHADSNTDLYKDKYEYAVEYADFYINAVQHCAASHINVHADSNTDLYKDRHEYSCEYADIYINADCECDSLGVTIKHLYKNTDSVRVTSKYFYIYKYTDQYGTACHVNIHAYSNADVYQDKYEHSCEYINIHIDQDTNSNVYGDSYANVYGHAYIYQDTNSNAYKNPYKYAIAYDFKYMDTGLWNADKYTDNHAECDSVRVSYSYMDK